MSVEMDFYIMRGIKFSEEVVDSLTEDQSYQLFDNDMWVGSDPMCSSEGIFGSIIFHGNQEDYELPVTDLKELLVDRGDHKIMEALPEFLKTDTLQISTYAFVRFG